MGLTTSTVKTINLSFNRISFYYNLNSNSGILNRVPEEIIYNTFFNSKTQSEIPLIPSTTVYRT